MIPKSFYNCSRISFLNSSGPQKYPVILEQAYNFHMNFKNIYKLEDLQKAKTALVDWIKRAQDSSIQYFQSVAESLIAHWERIVGFFTNRSTNAHAESLNAQIKLFRSNLRGVTDTKFFLYRLEKIFA